MWLGWIRRIRRHDGERPSFRMSHNPYTAPQANLTGADEVRAGPPRPVRLACQLVLAALVLSMLPAVSGDNPEAAGVPFGVAVAIYAGLFAVFGGLTVWFVAAVWRGRKWSRWVLLIYLLIGWVLGWSTLADDMNQAPLTALTGIVTACMEMIAMALLFVGKGTRWFDSRGD